VCLLKNSEFKDSKFYNSVRKTKARKYGFAARGIAAKILFVPLLQKD